MDGISTPSGMGFDSFRKRYEDLERLVELYEDHPLPLKETNKELNKWTTSLSNISPAYMFYADSYILADKGRCKNRKIWINRDLASHGDIQFILNNTHYRPSFEYQETFNFISSDEISIFTDGTFTPTCLFLSYIRYPAYIDKTGYVKFDGTDSTDVDCELKNYLEDELIDLAVQNLAMYTENAAAVQSAQFRIQTNE
jgi:hypothetical protein